MTPSLPVSSEASMVARSTRGATVPGHLGHRASSPHRRRSGYHRLRHRVSAWEGVELLDGSGINFMNFFTRHGHRRAIRVAGHPIEGSHRHHWVRGHPEGQDGNFHHRRAFHTQSDNKTDINDSIENTHMPWPWLWWTGQGSPSQVWAG